MIETAIITIRGERFLFKAADNLARQIAERNRTPGIQTDSLPVAGQTDAELGRKSHPAPAPRSFDNLLHSTGVTRGH